MATRAGRLPHFFKHRSQAFCLFVFVRVAISTAMFSCLFVAHGGLARGYVAYLVHYEVYDVANVYVRIHVKYVPGAISAFTSGWA